LSFTYKEDDQVKSDTCECRTLSESFESFFDKEKKLLWKKREMHKPRKMLLCALFD